MNEYITVAELSKAINISKQAIYKQINNEESPIHKYLVTQNRKTMIHKSAIVELYGKASTDSTEFQPKSTEFQRESTEFQPQIQPKSTESKLSEQDNSIEADYIKYLKDEIEDLKAALKEKDNLINDYINQISDMSVKLSEIAEKAINTTSQQQYLAAYDKTEKKSIFQRLFGK